MTLKDGVCGINKTNYTKDVTVQENMLPMNTKLKK